MVLLRRKRGKMRVVCIGNQYIKTNRARWRTIFRAGNIRRKKQPSTLKYYTVHTQQVTSHLSGIAVNYLYILSNIVRLFHTYFCVTIVHLHVLKCVLTLLPPPLPPLTRYGTNLFWHLTRFFFFSALSL